MKTSLRTYQTLKKQVLTLVILFISLLLAKPAAAQLNISFSDDEGFTVCQGTSYAINAFIDGGSGEYQNHLWTSPQAIIIFQSETSVTVNISSAGFYSLTFYVEDDEGNSGTATLNFEVLPSPPTHSITPAGPTTFCQGGSVVLNAITGVGYTYQWTRGGSNIAGATSSSYTATQGGTYRVIITAANGCARTSSPLVVTVNALPAATASNDGPVCEMGTVQFSSGPDAMVSYQWSGPLGFSSLERNPSLTDIPLTAAGVYTVRVTNSNNCSAEATTTLVVHPLPVKPASVSSNRNNICADDMADITLTAVGGSGSVLRWYSGSCGGTLVGEGTSITIGRPASTTTYYARWESAQGCSPSACESITINIFAPVAGGSIAASQSICYNGDPAPFTSTAAPSGGNGAFTYQWQSQPEGSPTWTNITGATAITYDAPAGLTITTSYRRIATNDCGSAASNVVTVTVSDPINPGTIAASQSICYNTTPAPFSSTAAPTGGSGSWTYSWESSTDGVNWNVLPASNSLAYTVSTALTQTTSYRRRASNTCGEAVSNTITVTVYTELNGGTIAASQNVCYEGDPAAFTSTAAPTGGNGPWSYQWESRVGAGAWNAITGATGLTYDVPAGITQTTSYRRIATNLCGSVASNELTITVYAQLNGGTIAADQSICFGGDPAAFTSTAAPSGGNGAFTYQWQSQPEGSATWTDISGATGITYDAPAGLTQTTRYRRVATNLCGSAISNVVTVTISPEVLGGTIAASQSICYNTTPAPFTSTAAPTGGSGSWTYSWESSTDGVNWNVLPASNSLAYTVSTALTQTTSYRRRASNTCGEAVSNTITVTVYAELNGGTIAASQNVCYEGDPAAFTSTAAPTGGNGPWSYQWESRVGAGAWNAITGATGLTYDVPAGITQTTSYRRIATNHCGSVASNELTITVYAQLNGGTIAADQSICFGGDPAAFTSTAAPSGGNGAFTYQWQSQPEGSATWTDISGATGITYDAPAGLTITTRYRRIATNLCGSAISNVVTVTVSDQILGGIIASNQAICFNEIPSAFTSTSAATGGTGPTSYSWERSTDGISWTPLVGATGLTYAETNALTQTTYYRRQATNDCGSAYSNTLTVTVNAELSGGSIGNNQSVCFEGDPASFINITAPQGGTGSWSYRWESRVGAGAWATISGATSITYDVPAGITQTTSYRRVAINTCGEAISNVVTVTVYAQLNGGTISENQTLCFGGDPVAFTNVASPNGGNGPWVYQWQSQPEGSSTWTAITGANQLTYDAPAGLTQTTRYRRMATNDCGTVYSNVVTITVSSELTPGSIAANQQICYNAIPAPFTSITAAQGGTGAISYQWERSLDGISWTPIAGATSASYSVAAGLSQTTLYRRAASNDCGLVYSNVLTVTVPDEPLGLVIFTTDVACFGGNEGTASAIVTGGTPFPGGVYQYLWSNGATTATITGLNAFDSPYTVVVTDAFGCTITGQAIINQPTEPLEAYAGADRTVCSGENDFTGGTTLGGVSGSPTAEGGVGPYTYLWTAVPADPSLLGQENLPNPIVKPNATTVYTVEVTDLNGCKVSDSVLITVHPTVFADAGGGADKEITLCQGGSINLGGTPLGTGPTGFGGSGNFTYNWATVPATAFNSTQAHPLVSPANTITYRVRVRDTANGCLAFDTVTVVVVPPIVVEAIADASVCNGNNTGVNFTLGATITGGSNNPANYQITWTANPADPSLAGQQNLLNPVVSPTVTTTYTISVTDSEGIACQGSDQVVITVFPEIVADAGDDITICNPANGGVATLGGSPTAGYANNAPGAFTYSWTSVPAGFTSTIANPEVAPLVTTTYYLEVTDANGCKEFDEITVSVLPQLIADAGSDIEICHPENGGQALLNGSATGGTPGYTYSWEPATGLSNASIANPIATPDATTTYTLTVTDNFGCEHTDEVTVIVTPQLVITITGDNSICHPANGGETTLSATVAGGTGSYTYLWAAIPADPSLIGQENLTTITVSPLQNTRYTLLVTDQGTLACNTSSSFDVEVLDELQLSIDASQEAICNPANGGISESVLTAMISGGSGNFSYLWSTGETTANITVTPAITTIYTLVVTDEDSGCTITETIEIEVLDLLVASAGADMTVCYQSEVELNGSASGGSGSGYTFLWSPAEGLSNPNIANPIFQSPENLNAGYTQTYTLTVTDNNGCEATDEITITVLPEIILNPGESMEVCFGSVVTLGGDAINPTAQGGSGNYIYRWTVGTGGTQFSTLPNPTVTINFTGSRLYTLFVEDITGGCFRTATVVLTAVSDPVVTLTANPSEICEGNSSTLTATGGTSYLWSTGETTAQIVVSPSATTTYSVTINTVCGPVDRQVTVTVSPGPVVDLGDDLEVCQGTPVVLDAGEFADVSYLWTNGSTNRTIEVTETGTYGVTVTSLINGCFTYDEVYVEFLPTPSPDAGTEQTICIGESVTLGGEEPVGGPASTYLWTSVPEDPSLTTPTIYNPVVSPLVSTVYTLTHTYTDNGCSAQSSVTISVLGGIADAGQDTTICALQPVVIGPENPVSSNTYSWTSSNPEEVFDNNIPNPTVRPAITTTYTLREEFEGFDCASVAQITITVNPIPEADAGSDKTICLGQTVTIGPDAFVPGPLKSYQWISDPEDLSISDATISNPTVSPLVTTTYTLIETYLTTGCTNENSIVVTVNPLPEAPVADDALICFGEAISIGAAPVSATATYSWTSIPAGFTSSEPNPLVVPSDYTLEADNTIRFILEVTENGCSASNEVTITVRPQLQAQVADDMTFCSVGEVGTRSIGGAAVPGYTYLWTSSQDPAFSSTEANPAVAPTVTTIYTLVVTDENDCSRQYTVTLAISDLAFVTIDNPEICQGDQTAALGANISISGGSAPYQYFWTDNLGNAISSEANPTVNAPFASSYNLMVMDADGCMINGTVSVDEIQLPELTLQVTPSNTIYVGQEVTFTALPATFDTYTFLVEGEAVQSGESNVYRSNRLHNEQQVRVMAEFKGCMAISEAVTIFINDLPNAFTPDGDGINDIFAAGSELIIFNRWGQKIYEGTEGWDGTFNGRKVSPGTYYYILNVYDNEGKKTVMNGSVTVILRKSE